MKSAFIRNQFDGRKTVDDFQQTHQTIHNQMSSISCNPHFSRRFAFEKHFFFFQAPQKRKYFRRIKPQKCRILRKFAEVCVHVGRSNAIINRTIAKRIGFSALSI